jgi:hypothetical protein
MADNILNNLTPDAGAVYTAALRVFSSLGVDEPERAAFRVVFNWRPPSAPTTKAIEEAVIRHVRSIAAYLRADRLDESEALRASERAHAALLELVEHRTGAVERLERAVQHLAAVPIPDLEAEGIHIKWSDEDAEYVATAAGEGLGGLSGLGVTPTLAVGHLAAVLASVAEINREDAALWNDVYSQAVGLDDCALGKYVRAQAAAYLERIKQETADARVPEADHG